MDKLYIALCQDRHSDPVVRVFRTAEGAIAYCKFFARNGNPYPGEIVEHLLSQELRQGGWLYYSTYSVEGDSVSAMETMLDPDWESERIKES